MLKPEKQIQQLKRKYDYTNHALKERIKELNCLYVVLDIISKYQNDSQKMILEVCKVIPESWQYPKNTHCSIEITNIYAKSHNFIKTKWLQKSKIFAGGKLCGEIIVVYDKKFPQEHEGPFLKEERLLIDAVAGYLGKAIEYCMLINSLKEREEELKKRNEELLSKNAMLKEMLSLIEEEKKCMAEKVIANAKHLLLPHIDKIAKKLPDEEVEILRKNVVEITSSFGASLSDYNYNLSTREIEVCSMIKRGLSSKDIAELLSLSVQTIDSYRKSIRKKCKLTGKNTNLYSFVRSL